LKLFKALLAN
jgi:hypothetical protein